MSEAPAAPQGQPAAPAGHRPISWSAHVRTARVVTGLVMLYYVFVHLINHSLGNISLDLMEAA